MFLRLGVLLRLSFVQVRGDVVDAEHVLIDQGKIDEAIDMYHSLQRWDDAIAVAESQGHSQAAHMKEQYFQVRLRLMWLALMAHGLSVPFLAFGVLVGTCVRVVILFLLSLREGRGEGCMPACASCRRQAHVSPCGCAHLFCWCVFYL